MAAAERRSIGSNLPVSLWIDLSNRSAHRGYGGTFVSDDVWINCLVIKKSLSPKKVLVIGHRGASGLYP